MREPIYERREAVIIANPAAHNHPATGRRGEIDAWLLEEGWRVEWQETQGPGDATVLAGRAAEAGVPLVMALGGDGTLNEAANGLAGSDTALGMIPGGTSNLWAREVGISRKPLEAVQQIVTGNVQTIDLGRAGERYFALLCGFGIDAVITRHVSPGIKSRVGAAAYGLTAVREALRWRGQDTGISLDGKLYRMNLLMALVGNTRLYAGVTQITPTAVADDGCLEVCLYRGSGKLDIALHATRTLLQLHRTSNKVVYRRVKRIEFDWGGTPLPAQVDGEHLDFFPDEVTVAPGALQVAVPAALVTPLFERPPRAARPAELTLPRPQTG